MAQFTVSRLLFAVTLFAVLCAVLVAFPANLSLFIVYSVLQLLLPVFIVLAVFGRDSLRAFAIGSATTWLISFGGIDAGPEVWRHLERMLSGATSPDQMVFQAKIVYVVMIAWILAGGLLSLCAYLIAIRRGIRTGKTRPLDRIKE